MFPSNPPSASPPKNLRRPPCLPLGSEPVLLFCSLMIVSLYLTRRFRAAQDAKTIDQGLQVFVGRVKFCEGRQPLSASGASAVPLDA